MNIIEDDKNKFLINSIEAKQKRNYGVDLLKIIAMINIINLHINRNSKLLDLNPFDQRYKQVYLLQIFSYWPVNTFGLISGLIGFKKYKFSNIIYLWFEYFYYSIFFSIYLYMKQSLHLKILLLSFFPLGIKRYWYVNAYFFMYLLLPFITSSIILLDRNKFTKLILYYFIMYSLYHTLLMYLLRGTNYDFSDYGYSSIWIIHLYIIGSYIGRFNANKLLIPKIFLFIIFILSSYITFEYTYYINTKYKFAVNILLNYLSPTIIIQALALIFLFSNMKINNNYIKKLLQFLIPLNFNVALIHHRVFSFKIPIIAKFFNYIRLLSFKYLFFKIYGISIIIYCFCAFFDYFRYILFKIFRVKKICNYIENYLF